MRAFELFGAKNLRFSKLMVCPHGQGGWTSADILQIGGGRGGQFFAILCGRLLWTDPNYFLRATRNVFTSICKIRLEFFILRLKQKASVLYPTGFSALHLWIVLWSSPVRSASLFLG